MTKSFKKSNVTSKAIRSVLAITLAAGVLVPSGALPNKALAAEVDEPPERGIITTQFEYLDSKGEVVKSTSANRAAATVDIAKKTADVRINASNGAVELNDDAYRVTTASGEDVTNQCSYRPSIGLLEFPIGLTDEPLAVTVTLDEKQAKAEFELNTSIVYGTEQGEQVFSTTRVSADTTELAIDTKGYVPAKVSIDSMLLDENHWSYNTDTATLTIHDHSALSGSVVVYTDEVADLVTLRNVVQDVLDVELIKENDLVDDVVKTLFAPQQAWAADAFDGWGWLYSTNPGPGWGDYTEYMIDVNGTNVQASCIEHGVWRIPEMKTGGKTVYYTATPTGENTEYWDTQDDTYTYHHWRTTVTYYVHVDAGTYQDVAGYYKDVREGYTWELRNGFIDVTKSSANEKITSENGCYSLENAQYGIYSDAGCTNLVATLTTDANGYAKSSALPVGNYWVKETQASKGYSLDAEIYPVVVKAHATSSTPSSQVKSSERPKSDPMLMKALVTKVDANGLPTGQGAAALEGAEYTVKYYDGYFKTPTEANEAVLAGKAHVTEWVFKTDANGEAGFAEEDKVSGSTLPVTSIGNPTLPLGTVTIQETKVPNGYKLDEKIHLQQITDNSGLTSVTSDVHTYQTQTSTEIVKRGDLRLIKQVPTSTDEEKRDFIVVEGVQFQIINATNNPVVSPKDGITEVAPGDVVCTITTDETGLASTKAGKALNGWETPVDWQGALPYGTYTIHEVIPDDVLAHYEDELGFKMLAVDDFPIQITEDAQYSTPLLVTNKIPNTPIKIKKLDTESNKEIFKSNATFSVYRVNKNGELGEKVTFNNHYTQTVEDTWTSNNGTLILPMKLDGGDFALVEQTAPDGYTLAAPVKFSVKDNNTWDNPQEVLVRDNPIKGELEIVKTDSTTGESIEGAEYIIRANADIVTGDGMVHTKAGGTIATVTTDANGIAYVGDLYLGSYTIQEIKAPNGYAVDSEEHVVEIVSQGQDTPVVKVRVGLVDKPSTLKIKKLSDKDDTPLANAEFKIWNDQAEPTMVFDEESVSLAFEGLIKAGAFDNILVANEAEFTTQVKDAFVAHAPSNISANANFNLNGVTYSAKVTVSTKFENDKPQSVVVTLDELPSEVVKYYDENNIAHASDTSIDWSVLALEKTNADGFSLIATTNDEGIIEVPYLKQGKYHIQETKAPVGYTITDEKVIDFEINNQGLVVSATGDVLGATGVVTVYNTPRDLKTTATDKQTGTHQGQASKSMTIVDAVEYSGCKAGKTYEVHGTLMDKTTGNAVLDEKGNPITSKKEFVADKPDGVVLIEFTFDSIPFAGKQVVVFEDMYEEGELFATHADINDDQQTVNIVDIKTTAHDSVTLSSIGSLNNEVSIVDTVEYTGLTVGDTMTVEGTLMDRQTNEPYMVDGKPVVANTTFVVSAPNGTIDVVFKFSGADLKGRSLVVFENLIKDNKIVATHADINDEGQTVNYPTLHTTATDSATSDHTGYAAEEVTIVDAVEYTKLIPEKTYKVSGKLMDRLTGKDFLVDGKPVIAEKEFVAEKPDGVVELEFKFNGSALAGRTIVVFEDLYYENTLVATHSDLEDANQTVEYKAKIHTTATDAADGDHIVEAKEQVTIIDKVSFDGLIKGNKYTMYGKLMNKATGAPIQQDGKDLVVQKEFEAQDSKGEVEMEFTFNTSELAGSDVVVFEDCYGEVEGQTLLVATHADINDEGQTVSVSGVPYDKTGTSLVGLTSLAAALALGGASLTASELRRRKLSRKDNNAPNSDEEL